jgi:hypothetical protein
MGLTVRSVFGAATLATILAFAAAQASRAQNSPSPAPAGQAAPQSTSQSPPSSATSPGASPGNSPTAPTTEIPDANKPPETTHGQHTVTVTFDYDFRLTPACSKKVVVNCVQQFVAYDISAGAKKATFLFPIALPTNPVNLVHSITATSPKLDFESGKHLISVTAQGPDGKQSRKSVCTTWIEIP